ncbi:MAG: ribonucleoside-diphosphate reductase subunit alpha [Patescibacteria group bacterium]|jgi:ribonucleoside-diphosphate reductase alpha chain
MPRHASVIDALSNNDLVDARDILLEEVLVKTQGRGSWDSPQYRGDADVQRKIVTRVDRNALLTYFGLENLRDRYFLKDATGRIVEDPQMFFSRVACGMARGDAEHAQRLYDAMSMNWFMPATPVLTNTYTNRGLPISCFLNTVEDSIEGIYAGYAENAFISKNGGGIGTSWSELRGQNAPLSMGGTSSGVIPFIKVMDSSIIAVSQGGVRRGAGAAYLRVDHPDIEEFIDIRKPVGDMNRRCLNTNHGLVVTDEFMKAVEEKRTYQLIDPKRQVAVKELDATEVWRKILKTRVETGEPYLLFIDTVNRAVPAHHAEKGLFIQQSNLCSEITLPTTHDRTAVCCLSSLNLERFDEWESQAESLINDAVRALDNVLDNFVEAADPKYYAKSINSVKHERSIGLGVMGYHGYLMSKNLPFESMAARSINKKIFSLIHTHAKAASRKLKEERGAPLDGGDQRNSYILSIAPTASISFICGEATPCVEPITGNAYLQKTLSGSFLVKGRHLEKLFEKKGINTVETWKKVIAAKGSVQHMEELTDEEKAVFRTGYEMNMREIVQQAADRQPYLCQSQSVNLFFPTPISGKYLHDAHFLAWKAGAKSLYYLRSAAPIEADAIDNAQIKMQARDFANEECAVCQ